MTSPLEDKLLLLLISSSSSIETMHTLALVGLWPIMREFACDGHFWYMRTQHHQSRGLEWRPGEGKTVYWNLSRIDAVPEERIVHYDTARVMLECGYDSERARSGDLITAATSRDL